MRRTKKKTEKARKAANPSGCIPMAAGFGIYVIGVECCMDDYVVWRWTNEDRIRRSKVVYGKNGPRFRAGGTWHALGDVERIQE